MKNFVIMMHNLYIYLIQVKLIQGYTICPQIIYETILCLIWKLFDKSVKMYKMLANLKKPNTI